DNLSPLQNHDFETAIIWSDCKCSSFTAFCLFSHVHATGAAVKRFRSLDFSLKFLLITPSKPVNAMRLPNLDHVRDAMSNNVSRCLFCFFLNSLSRSPATPTTMAHLPRFPLTVSLGSFIHLHFIIVVRVQISVTSSQRVNSEFLSHADWCPPCHRGRSRPRMSWGEGLLQSCR
ncbi:hypothetical protein CMEL01_10097, partial [Colletotrichum melonis]